MTKTAQSSSEPQTLHDNKAIIGSMTYGATEASSI